MSDPRSDCARPVLGCVEQPVDVRRVIWFDHEQPAQAVRVVVDQRPIGESGLVDRNDCGSNRHEHIRDRLVRLDDAERFVGLEMLAWLR